MLAAVAFLALWHSSALSAEAQALFDNAIDPTSGTISDPTAQTRANALNFQAGALSNAFTPLVTGAALSLIGGLVVLARWWSVRAEPEP